MSNGDTGKKKIKWRIALLVLAVSLGGFACKSGGGGAGGAVSGGQGAANKPGVLPPIAPPPPSPPPPPKPAVISISGNLVKGQVLDFGKPEGPTDSTFALTNLGESEARFQTSSLSPQDFFSGAGGTCTVKTKLAPGEACTYIVRFKPVPGESAASTFTMKFFDGVKDSVTVTLSLLGAQDILDTPGVKIFEYGTDFRNPLDKFGRHITQDIVVNNMETKPFHGTAIRFNEFFITFSKNSSHTLAKYQDRIDALRALKFKKFRENFIGFATAPGVMGHVDAPDWFDSDEIWQNGPINNVKVLAQIAKTLGYKGLMMDPEDYCGSGFSCTGAVTEMKIWEYATRPRRNQFSKQQYIEKARSRGVEMMRAINSVYPGITFLTYWCYDIPAVTSGNATLRYELLAPFCDGLIQAADERTKVHLVSENTYCFGNIANICSSNPSFRIANPGGNFEAQLRGIKAQQYEEARRKTTNPSKLERHFRVGFAIYLKRFGNQFRFSPTQYEDILRAMINQSDGYIMVYNEDADWWLNPSPIAGHTFIEPNYLRAGERAFDSLPKP